MNTRREQIIDLLSLEMDTYEDAQTNKQVFSTEYGSLTQTFCFRRVIRELGYNVISTSVYYRDSSREEVMERHFNTDMPVEQFNEMVNIYNDYIESNEIEFYVSSSSSNSYCSSPAEIEPQNDDSDN